MKKKIFALMGLVVIFGTAPLTSFAADELLKTEVVLNKQELEGVNQYKILELLKEVLDTEVLEGIITQQEADAKYQEIENGNIPPFGAKPIKDESFNGENMTDEERIQNLKEMLDKKVEEGKLTQTEADEKYTAIKNGEKPEKPESDERPENDERPEKPDIEERLDKPENIENQKTRLNDTERLALYQKILNYQVQNEYLTQTEADKKYEEMKEDISKNMISPQNEK